ncbi:hypothetical protein SAMN06273572_103161 [Monaibacterium marinum]|uniref:Uncharacterized protein n=2 Tax=Pontivivens marinum TaxID=1690039 RepID=A0A2C9CS15_9RHOB|nr:hypothetical protein SAMN06273572_103161 [Monaibacterium marinum]
MSRSSWHMNRTDTVLTLSRQLPARFDVDATASFPALRRGRLAHLIRQDLWRALQSLRGYSPVVEVTNTPDGVVVRAGGRVAGPVTQATQARIAAVLADPDNRARWIANARLPVTAR